MGTYLNEDQVAQDDTFIAYPHLLLCMGVTVLMDDGDLIGAHYVGRGSEDSNSQKFINLVANHGGNMKRMYMTGNF